MNTTAFSEVDILVTMVGNVEALVSTQGSCTSLIKAEQIVEDKFVWNTGS